LKGLLTQKFPEQDFDNQPEPEPDFKPELNQTPTPFPRKEPKMPSVNQFYGSGETLREADLAGRDVTVTIANVLFREFDDGNKIELQFSETDKKLILNVTNARTIADMYGDNTDGWAGRPITLFPTTTDFSGKRVACIRIREAVQQLQPQTAMAGAPLQQPQQFAPQPPQQVIPQQVPQQYGQSPVQQAMPAQQPPQQAPQGHPAALEDEIPF